MTSTHSTTLSHLRTVIWEEKEKCRMRLRAHYSWVPNTFLRNNATLLIMDAHNHI